jgi:tetratricopeptide (TPR) repeat protein
MLAFLCDRNNCLDWFLGHASKDFEASNFYLQKDPRSEVLTCKILPPSPSHEIQLRNDELAKIKKTFVMLRSQHGTGVIVVSITGYPGFGKSQLARQYAIQYYDEAMLRQGRVIVATLSAENLNTMDKSLVSIAWELRCHGVITLLENVEDPKRRMQLLIPAIAEKLRMMPNWLLLIDNLCNATKDTLDAYWPQPGSPDWGDGAVLITSQEQGIGGLSSHSVEIPACEMKEDDAVALLTTLSNLNDPKGAAEVAKRLDYIPLPLSSAAVYVKFINEEGDTGEKTDWHKYLQELDIGLQKDSEHFLALKNTNYPQTMHVAVSMAADHMARSRVELRQAFMFIGYCANQLLPLSCFEHFAKINREITKWRFAKSQVVKCSLLIMTKFIVKDQELQMIKAHQVTHSVFKMHIKLWLVVDWPLTVSQEELQQSAVMECTLESLNRSYEEANDSEEVQERYTLRRMYLPHLQETSNYSEKHLPKSTNLAKAIENSADVFDLLGDRVNRLESLERARTVYQEVSGEELSRSSEFWLNLGCALEDTDKRDEGIAFIKKCLSIRQKSGANPRAIARALFSLGLAHIEKSEYDQGIKELKEALEKQSLVSQESMLTGSILTALGRAYLDKGDLEAAKGCLDRAENVMKNAIGDKHPAYAKVLVHLGRYYLEKPKLNPPEAVRLLEMGLDIRRQHLGDDHNLVVTGMVTLARAHMSNSQLEKSKKMFEEVRYIQRQKNVLHGSAYCRALILLAKVLLKERGSDNLKGAIQLLTEARCVGVSALGEDHYEMAYVYHVMGVAYYLDGNVCEGKRLLQKAKQLISTFYGEGHYEAMEVQETIDKVERGAGVEDLV